MSATVSPSGQGSPVAIDVHTHFIPAGFVTETPTADDPGRYRVDVRDGDGRTLITASASASMAGFEIPQLVDPARRMADMDRQGVAKQVLSVPPPFGFFYTQEPAAALGMCEAFNNELVSSVEAHRDRFLPMATVPMQAPELAVRELTRAVSDLGMAGVEIATRIGEDNLDAPQLDEFYAAAERLSVPVFVHSTRGLGAERLKSYHLGNLIGNPTEDAIAASSLIFGGVMERFPRLKIYLAHGGGSCPFLLGRWDRGWKVRPETRVHQPKAPSTAVKDIRFDSLTHDTRTLGFLVETCGADRVMLGTDYPYDMGEPDPVGAIAALDGLPQDDIARILVGNAQALFGVGT